MVNTMKNLRNKVIEALETRLGEEYRILPKDIRKNNGLTLHGICLHRKGDSLSPVIYVEEFIRHCDMDGLDPEVIADVLLNFYHQNIISCNAADHLKDFRAMKERVRIKLVNYTANLRNLGNIPHRRFLDLAVTYYLDLEQYACTTVTNELMGIWGITEDGLYRPGMEKLLSGDDLCVNDIFSALKPLVQEGPDKMTEDDIAGLEQNWCGPEMYVATNKKCLFGANCLMHVPLLQKLAENLGCSLIIYPSSVHEIVIIPQKKGSEDIMDTGDIKAINIACVSRDEWLSNSIYRYDRYKKEVSIFRKGEPL